MMAGEPNRTGPSIRTQREIHCFRHLQLKNRNFPLFDRKTRCSGTWKASPGTPPSRVSSCGGACCSLVCGSSSFTVCSWTSWQSLGQATYLAECGPLYKVLDSTIPFPINFLHRFGISNLTYELIYNEFSTSIYQNNALIEFE